MQPGNTILTKKGLKNFINENGFFIHIRELEKMSSEDAVNHLEKLDEAFRTKIKLPKEKDNIQVFRGLASQYYGKGKKSRNGYKYDHKGIDLKNYKKNPLILLGHDSNKPIGFALSLEVKEGVGMEIVYFVDYETKAAKENEHELKNGYIGMLSTGAITREWMIEDAKTGELMSPDKAREAGVDLWAVFFGQSDDYIMVVTKSELIENSQVTIGSNEDAQTKGDSLGNFFTNQLEKMNISKSKSDSSAKNAEEKKSEINLKIKVDSSEVDKVLEKTQKLKNSEEDKEEPTENPKQPEEKNSDPENAEKDGEKPESGNEEAESSEKEPENGESSAANEEKEEGETSENEEKKESGEEETTEQKEPEAEAENSENELVEMTKALAKNLLALEKDVSNSKGLKEDDVKTLIEEKLKGVISEQNEVIEKSAKTIVALSNKVKELNVRLDKVAVNKPHIIHSQFEKAKAKKKDSWA